MSTIITRLYADRGRATSAVAELGHLPLGRGAIHVIDAAGHDAARLATHLERLHVAPNAAAAYAAEAARTGGALVVVDAPFGQAGRVQEALGWTGATALEVDDRHRPLNVDDPAPLSDMLGLPVLTSGKSNTRLLDNPAPFSRMLGLPVLTAGKSKTRLMNEPAPLSRALGLPVLTSGESHTELLDCPAPLSKGLGLPVLIRSIDDDHRRD